MSEFWIPNPTRERKSERTESALGRALMTTRISYPRPKPQTVRPLKSASSVTNLYAAPVSSPVTTTLKEMNLHPRGRANNKQTSKSRLIGRDTCPVQRTQIILRTPGTPK